MAGIMNIDTEKLILEVKTRKNLWNPSHQQYKSRDARTKSWIEVARRVIKNFDSFNDEERKKIVDKVQQRWKSARDAYKRIRTTSRKLRSVSAGKTLKQYIYSSHLQFLDAINDPNRIDSNHDRNEAGSEKTVQNQDDTETREPFHDGDSSNEALCQRKRCRISTSTQEVLKPNKDNEDDEDRAFLSSLLPTLRLFDNDQKLTFRIQTLNILMNIKKSQSNAAEHVPSTKYDIL